MNDKEHLDDLCSRLHLSDAGVRAVMEAVEKLARLEHNKVLWKPGLQRKAELETMARQATALFETLENFDPRNDLNMVMHLRERGLGPGLELRHSDGWWINHWKRAVQHLLDQLVLAAEDSEKSINKDSLREGRKSMTDVYALHVSNLASVLCWTAEELKFGRNNDFHLLCDAIFSAARVPAKSEGAIKYLQAHIKRNDFKESLLRQ